MTGIVIKESLVVKKSLELITTMKYDYKAVEAKWQKVWEDEKTFHAEIDHSKPIPTIWRTVICSGRVRQTIPPHERKPMTDFRKFWQRIPPSLFSATSTPVM